MGDCTSLYIHIPYCKSKCFYCDFFSQPAQSVPDEYAEALCRQIAFFKTTGTIKELSTVYFGGGTPSLLSQQQVKKIFSEIAPLLRGNCEITFECNPESLTEDFLECLVSVGVNRVSIGVQSLNDNALHCVHRLSKRADCLKVLALLSSHGTNFSVDLIAGLPQQSEQEFIQSLQDVVSFNPHHISLYALTIEENTPLYKKISQGKIICSPEDIDGQWLIGQKLLEDAGYLQYEVSNFAQKGYESRHNRAYWNQESYIGAGAGATGTLYQSENGVLQEGVRFTNTNSIDRYIEYWKNSDFSEMTPSKEPITRIDFKAMPGETETLSSEVLAFEYFMLGLRKTDGICVEEYENRFKRKFPKEVFEKGVKQRIVIKNNTYSENILNGVQKTHYAMSEKGLLFLNSFLEELLP